MVMNDLVTDNCELTLVLVLQDHFRGRAFKTTDHAMLLNRYVKHSGALSQVLLCLGSHLMSVCFIHHSLSHFLLAMESHGFLYCNYH